MNLHSTTEPFVIILGVQDKLHPPPILKYYFLSDQDLQLK